MKYVSVTMRVISLLLTNGGVHTNTAQRSLRYIVTDIQSLYHELDNNYNIIL